MESPKFNYYEGGLTHLRSMFDLDVRKRIRSQVSSSQNDELLRVVNRYSSGERFLGDLKEAWDRHNRLGLLIDRGLEHLWGTSLLRLPPNDIEFLAQAIPVIFQVDLEKRLLSFGVKPMIDKELENKKAPQTLSVDEFRLLLTPMNGTVFEKLHLGMLRLRVKELEVSGDASDFAQETADQYFCGSREYLDSAMQVIRKRADVDGLRDEIKRIVDRSRQVFIKKQYFLSDHPRFVVIDRLLEYDNNDEYLHMMNLYGMPDYLLRKYIVDGLAEGGLIEKRASVIDYSQQEYVDGLNRLIRRRKKKFNQPIKGYLQTGFTCGVSCLMSVLNELEGFTPSREHEYALFRKIQIGDYPNNPSSGLAREFVERGYRTVLIHSERDFFKYSPLMNKLDFDCLTDAYIIMAREAEGKGLEIAFHEINSEQIIRYLRNGALVIPIVHLGGGVLHDVVVHGYKDTKMLYFDPLSGEKGMYEKRFDDYVKTPYGSWMVVIYDKKHDGWQALKDQMLEI